MTINSVHVTLYFFFMLSHIKKLFKQGDLKKNEIIIQSGEFA